MMPLQVGVPGGMELFVILLIALIVFGVPIVLVGGGLYLYRQSQSGRPAGTGREIEELRSEVERLRAEVDRLEGDRSEDDDEDWSKNEDRDRFGGDGR